MVKPSPRIMVVSFPAQGHINPGLQLAKQLVSMGVQVTFVTTVSAIRRMNKTTSLLPEGLSFGSFSDGYDDGFKPSDDVHHYMTEFRRVGSQTLSEFIVNGTQQGNHYSCIVYSILLTWVEEVAAAVNIPITPFWIQTATMFDIYHYYFNGYGDVIRNNINEASFSLKLEGLPELASRDLPAFFDPSNPYSFVLPLFQEQMELLDGKSHSKVLVNTFDALESEALKAMSKYNLVGIGPLIPSAFLDGKDPSDTSFGGDLLKGTTTCKDYMEWLDSKPESSVIYVSFGSISMLSKPQMEELAQGLLKTGRPFLWVIREKREEDKKEDEELSCVKELEEQGKIVTWCSQVEVLSHKSLGCFMTHCGWNSTFESLYFGVPMVAFPQWTDQATNAKMVEDVWKIGVRVNFNNQGIVDRDEFYKCLELVMGSKEMRDNAKKWMELAREAAKEGGSSHKNLQEFVDEISVL